MRPETVILLVVTFAGAFTEGITGIGFFMICMSVLPAFYEYQTVMFAVKLMAILQGSILVCARLREVRWRVLAIPLGVSLLSSLVGLRLLDILPVALLQRMLGVVLIGVSVLSLAAKGSMHIRPSLRNGCLAGVCSGFLSGTVNIPGPPLVLYYMGCFSDDKNLYFSTICATFLFQNIFQITLQTGRGMIGAPIIQLFAYSIPSCLLGYYLGRRVFSRIDIEMVRRGLYIIMVLMGLRSLLL